MIRLPVTVEPVNEIRSTRGSSVRSSPTKWSDALTTLTTPAGMSVRSAMSRPSRVAFHGVSGAGLTTTVFPVARMGPSLLAMTSNGKFQGMIAPTTPCGSLTTRRRLWRPKASLSGSCRSHWNCSRFLAGQRKASSSGASNCAE